MEGGGAGSGCQLPERLQALGGVWARCGEAAYATHPKGFRWGGVARGGVGVGVGMGVGVAGGREEGAERALEGRVRNAATPGLLT